MKLPVESQSSFLTWQIKEHEIAFLSYLKRPMNQHFKDKTAFCGKLWGVDEKRGSLIIRFPKGLSPRLKSPFAGFVFSGIAEADNLAKWDFSYEFFRENYIRGNTDISPIFYLKNQDKLWSYIGCKDVDAGFLNSMQKLLDADKKPSIVLAQKDPPIQYLLNLRDFVINNSQDPVLNIDILKTLDEWEPESLALDNRENAIIENLNGTAEVIIQGPPGTGKSHLIADITSKYLSEGKSICITALTNKALMEVAGKPGIKEWINKEKVFKTNLAFDESVHAKKLQRAESLKIGKGQLLLATYYKLSDWYKKENSESQTTIKPVYDIVIIEEASQCFLATIAAFRKLGKKVLIVGDPLQLPPIVLNENVAPTIHPRMMDFARGLETYAANSGTPSFLLTQTFRLSAQAAVKTGIFYKGRLTSVQESYHKVNTSVQYNDLVPTDGSTKLVFLPIIADGDRPKNAIDLAVDIVIDLLGKNPGFEIAVIAPFKNTVLAMQEKLGEKIDDFSNLTVETIDRIQGLTADFTIYVLALSNPTFAMNLNRFNVATSRAKSGTLIITDRNYIKFMGIDPLVTQYLSSLESITL